MEIENAKQQMRKGILEFCILALLDKMGDAYPSEILEQLKNAKLIIVEGTLYPLLTRLKNDDYLTYRWEESTMGPPRKYYKLTPTGKEFFAALETNWEELTTSVKIILEQNNNK